MLKNIVLVAAVTSMVACTQTPVNKKQTSETKLAAVENQRQAPAASFVSNNSGMLLDAASTTASLASGLVEMNPVLSGVCGTDPIMVGLCAFGGKKLLEKGAIYAFRNNPDVTPEKVTRVSNSIGFFAGCSNLVVLSGAVLPLGLLAGGLCGASYWQFKTKRQKELEELANVENS